jgi:hypothetical protein
MNIDDLRKEGNDAVNHSVHTMQIRQPKAKAVNSTFEYSMHARSELRGLRSNKNAPESSLKSNMNAP